jgi:hypothetical protein
LRLCHYPDLAAEGKIDRLERAANDYYQNSGGQVPKEQKLLDKANLPEGTLVAMRETLEPQPWHPYYRVWTVGVIEGGEITRLAWLDRETLEVVQLPRYDPETPLKPNSGYWNGWVGSTETNAPCWIPSREWPETIPPWVTVLGD